MCAPQKNVHMLRNNHTLLFFFRTKEHYGNLFKQAQFDKDMVNKRHQRRAEIVRNNNQEALIYMMFALGGLFFLLLFQGKSEYDIDKVSINKAKERRDQVEQPTNVEGNNERRDEVEQPTNVEGNLTT